MSENKLALLVIAMAISFQMAFAFWAQDSFKADRISYDCRLAEISPDYPVAIKQQCRKLISKKETKA